SPDLRRGVKLEGTAAGAGLRGLEHAAVNVVAGLTDHDEYAAALTELPHGPPHVLAVDLRLAVAVVPLGLRAALNLLLLLLELLALVLRAERIHAIQHVDELLPLLLSPLEVVLEVDVKLFDGG